MNRISISSYIEEDIDFNTLNMKLCYNEYMMFQTITYAKTILTPTIQLFDVITLFMSSLYKSILPICPEDPIIVDIHIGSNFSSYFIENDINRLEDKLKTSNYNVPSIFNFYDENNTVFYKYHYLYLEDNKSNVILYPELLHLVDRDKNVVSKLYICYVLCIDGKLRYKRFKYSDINSLIDDLSTLKDKVCIICHDELVSSMLRQLK